MKRHLHELQEDRAPAPDAIVRYKTGEFGPIMFHYLSEVCDWRAVAHDNGFDMRWLDMDGAINVDRAAYEAYESSDLARAIELWTPEPPQGWTLSGAFDGEDGLGVLFLRKIEANPAALPARHRQDRRAISEKRRAATSRA